ncbi:GNAT family N-acetyltransferase [Paraglaciecola sp.]|uniref:GNAT family N-acetyltransferase n=1 Tax=Paraglaciecola sp. TaxID=1920173 RepID=UPI0030F3BC5D
MTLLSHSLNGYQVQLKSMSQADIEQVRLWRNDPQVAQHMLSQDSISAEQQQAWFNKIKDDKRQQHFVINYKGQAIGAANIRAYFQGENLHNARAIEPGLYIADERYRGNILAFSPTLLLNDYCFEVLGAQKLMAVVKASNTAALNYNLKLGYQVEKSGDLLEISLNYADYQDSTKGLKALLNRPARATKD